MKPTKLRTWCALCGIAVSLLSSGTSLRAEARMARDVEYGQAAGERLLLDACVPDGAGPFPVVIIVHGGGWSGGDKKGATKPNDGADITPLFAPLTQGGFVWLSINYRLAPQHHWPAALEDIQTAIRWVKAHAADYRGDPRRIAIMGHSAGGHIICQAAVLATEETRVQAVVGHAAPTDLVADCKRRGLISPALRALMAQPGMSDDDVWPILADVSPINHVRAGLPPFVLIHGTEDKSVPFAQSLAFQAKLKEHGVRCDLVPLTGAPHRLTEWGKADPQWPDRMVAWLRQTLPDTPRP